MGKEEFKKEATKLGYTDEVINEIIKTHEEAKKEGIKMNYEDDLVELPIYNNIKQQ